MIRTRFVLATLMLAFTQAAISGNCVIRGDKRIGDCSNVSVGSSKPLVVARSGTYSGNYSEVVIKSGAIASISGNTGNILVEKGAKLLLTGNSDDIRVFGVADIRGNADHVIAEDGAQVTLRGIVDSVSGSGKVRAIRGAIVGDKRIE
jgi:hypothetical protein